MKQGRTIGGVLIYRAILSVTQSGVYAAHFIAGGGPYTVTSSMAEIGMHELTSQLYASLPPF